MKLVLINELIDLQQNVVVSQINTRDKYYFDYKVSDDKGTNWMKVPLKSCTFQELINIFKNRGLKFE